MALRSHSDNDSKVIAELCMAASALLIFCGIIMMAVHSVLVGFIVFCVGLALGLARSAFVHQPIYIRVQKTGRRK